MKNKSFESYCQLIYMINEIMEEAKRALYSITLYFKDFGLIGKIICNK